MPTGSFLLLFFFFFGVAYTAHAASAAAAAAGLTLFLVADQAPHKEYDYCNDYGTNYDSSDICGKPR